MTDFFAELEGHLHGAARRRARRARAMPPLTAAIALVAAVAVIASIGPGKDPEVAAPAPTPVPPAAVRVDCRADAVPQAVRDTFAILRSREPARPMPAGVQEHLTRGSLNTTVARAWTDEARYVQGGYASYWVVPVLLGEPCAEDDATRLAGACLIVEQPEASVPVCRPLGAIRAAEAWHYGRTDDGRGFVAALVPDGRTFHVEVAGRRENGMTNGNVGEKAFVATPEQTRRARVYFESLDQKVQPGCFTLTEAQPDPRVLELLPELGQARDESAGGAWLAGGVTAAGTGAKGVQAAFTREVGERGGWRFSITPVQQVGCAEPGEGPGACVVATSGDGAAAEARAWCWTVDAIGAGSAAASVEVGPDRKIGFELRSGELAAFCNQNPGACEDPAQKFDSSGFRFVDP